jgi:hypothetical protein
VIVEDILVCLVEHADDREDSFCHLWDERLHRMPALEFQEFQASPTQSQEGTFYSIPVCDAHIQATEFCSAQIVKHVMQPTTHSPLWKSGVDIKLLWTHSKPSQHYLCTKWLFIRNWDHVWMCIVDIGNYAAGCWLCHMQASVAYRAGQQYASYSLLTLDCEVIF